MAIKFRYTEISRVHVFKEYEVSQMLQEILDEANG